MQASKEGSSSPFFTAHQTPPFAPCLPDLVIWSLIKTWPPHHFFYALAHRHSTYPPFSITNTARVAISTPLLFPAVSSGSGGDELGGGEKGFSGTKIGEAKGGEKVEG